MSRHDISCFFFLLSKKVSATVSWRVGWIHYLDLVDAGTERVGQR